MKHIYPHFVISFALLLLLALSANGVLTAQESWEFIGSPNISNGVSDGGHGLAFNSLGEAYVAYRSTAGLSVKKYNGTTWEFVGAEGFANTASVFNRIALEFDNSDIPYIAFREASGTSVSVMAFDGVSWNYIGGQSFINSSEDPAFGFFNNIPVIAVSDDDFGRGITAKFFDGVNWITLGTENFTGLPVNQVNLEVFSNETPVIAFNTDLIGFGASVYFLDIDPMNNLFWNPLGPTDFADPFAYLSLAIADDDTPYVAFADGGDARVMQYDGTNWVFTGGNQSFTGSGFAEYTRIDVDGTTPYIGYRDIGGMTVQKFEDNVWEVVGESAFTPGDVFFSNLQLNGSTPIVAFTDFANSAGASVMEFTCTANLVDLVIELDDFPNETTWSIFDENGATMSSGGNYAGQQQDTIFESICLETGCYEFVIFDSIGDGICCGFGNGSYALTFQDIDTLAAGGEFDFFESTTFCIASDDELPKAFVTSNGTELDCFNPAITLDGVLSLAENPISYEWLDAADQTISTDTNIVVQAPGLYVLSITDQVTLETDRDSVEITQVGNITENGVEVRITFDRFPDETTLFIIDAMNDTLLNVGPFLRADSFQTRTFPLCLPNACYDFVITDNFGDGICCLQGDGSYLVTSTLGDTLAQGGAFTFSETTNFCLTDPLQVGIFAPNTTLDCNFPTIDLIPTISNATGVVNFEWFDENNILLSTASSLVVSTPGTYRVRATDTGNGNVDEETIEILEEITAPSIFGFNASATVLNCNTQQIFLNPTIFQTTFFSDSTRCSWSTGSNDCSIDVTTPGTYVLTVTSDSTGCSTMDSIIITQDIQDPTASITAPTTQLNCAITSIALDASSSMGNSLTYSWSNGATTPQISVISANTYFVTVTDGQNGCTSVESVIITQDVNLPTANITSATTELNCTVGSIELDASSSVGNNLTYVWSTGATTAQITVTSAGTYTVTITDGTNGCTATESTTITENTTDPTAVVNASATALTCVQTSIDLDAGGSTGNNLTYAWSTGATTAQITVTDPNTYTVTITDGSNGCTATESTTITENITDPTAAISSAATELNCTVNSIDLDASISTGNNLSYVWSTSATTAQITVTSAGTYMVTVTDGQNGCTASESIEITQDGNLPTVNITSATTELNCTVGSIELDASSSVGNNLTYVWSTGATTTQITVTSAGTYTVTVTDGTNGCTATESTIITQDGSLPTVNINLATTQLDCAVNSIDLDAGGSIGSSLTYAWSTGATTALIIVTSADTYTVTVTDGTNGCTATESVMITQDTTDPIAEINTALTELNCTISSINLDASSSMGNNLSFNWSTGATTAQITVTSPDTYTVTVTDENNSCTAVESIIITQDASVPVAQILASATELNCTLSAIDLDAGGSTGNSLTYIWSTGATTSQITVTTADTYTVTITDGTNSCTATESTVITQDASVPTASINAATNQLDCAVSSINLDAGNSVGNNLTYVWSTGATTAQVTVTNADTYIVTVTDGTNSCTATESVVVTQNTTDPTAVINAALTELSCNVSSIDLDASASSGNSLSYNWSNGATTAEITVTSPDTYSVTITDSQNSCTAVESIVITQDASVPVAVISAFTTELNCTTTAIDLDASPSTGNTLSYNWSTGASAAQITITSDGTYTVTVTDGQNGCESIENIVITSDTQAPAISLVASDTQLDCDTDAIMLDAGTSVGNSFSYIWSTGEDVVQIIVENPDTYTVTVTDGTNGCTTVESIVIEEDIQAPTVVIDPSNDQLDCSATTVTLNASGSIGSNLSYSWSTGASTAQIDISVADTYTVTVTDGSNACVSTESITVSADFEDPEAVILAPNTLLDCNITSANLDASTSTGSALQFNWSTGASTAQIIVIAPGDYTVTVTNGENGCTDIETITVTQDIQAPNAIIGSSATQLDCITSSIDLDAGGSSGNNLSYEWSSGQMTAEITISSAGNYTVTITDGINGCTSTESIDINENTQDPDAIIESVTTQLDCNVGSIDLNAGNSIAGNPVYQWSSGQTSAQITISIAGTFTVTVTDASNGCIDETSITITEDFEDPTVVLLASEPELNCTTTQLSLDASGSVGDDLTYIWSNGESTSQINITEADNYTVTITDGQNGCTASEQIIVNSNTEAPDILIGASSLQIGCDVSTVAIDVDLSSVSNPSVLWSTGSTDELIEVNTAGTYSVTVTDQANGCTAQSSIDIGMQGSDELESNFLVSADACTGDLIQFIDYSLIDDDELLGATFNWDFGNGDGSTERDPVCAYGTPGTYDINLKVSTPSCPMLLISKTIEVISCRKLESDGILTAELNPTLNDGTFQLKAYLTEFTDVSVRIYSLDGTMISSEFIQNVNQLNKQYFLRESGIYFVQLVHPFGAKTLKTIVID